jgi:hypothetical protein
MRLRILAAFFFHCLFLEKDYIHSDELRQLAVPIAKAAKAPVNDTMAILEQVEYVKSVEDFVAQSKLIIENPRMELFNLGILSMLVGGTWFGTGGREMAQAAMEHPPTFLSMLYLSFAQKGYKNAGLTRVTDRYKGPKGELEFTRAIYKLLSA